MFNQSDIDKAERAYEREIANDVDEHFSSGADDDDEY